MSSEPKTQLNVPAEGAATNLAINAPIGVEREIWRSEELLGTRKEVVILHGDQRYRLRQTRQGKLILYK